MANNSRTVTQSGSATSGAAIGGQVTGVVAGPGGSVNLRRTNRTSGQSISSAPASISNVSRTPSRATAPRSSGGSAGGSAGGGSSGGGSGGSKPPLTVASVRSAVSRRRGRGSHHRGRRAYGRRRSRG